MSTHNIQFHDKTGARGFQLLVKRISEDPD